MKKRPKPSELAKSVDKFKKPMTPEERRAQIGIAISVATVMFIYIAVIFFMKGCVLK